MNGNLTGRSFFDSVSSGFGFFGKEEKLGAGKGKLDEYGSKGELIDKDSKFLDLKKHFDKEDKLLKLDKGKLQKEKLIPAKQEYDEGYEEGICHCVR